MSDDLHKAQVPIRVIDDKGLSGVKFFKTPKFEKDTLLCRLNFRVSPLKRKLKVRGLFCNFLSTICHCLFDCCTVFERVFHIIPFCSTILRMTLAKFRSTVRSSVYSKLTFFRGKFCVLRNREEKWKKQKRKGNATRSRNISNGFYHTCMQNTWRDS